jgi:hypothetical protein
VDGRVIAQIKVVVTTIRGDEVDEHQEVGRFLPDRDPLLLNRRRQLRHRKRHAVLDHHERRVQVGVEVKGDGQRVRAVVPRLRRNIEDAGHAVDLLLDLLGHGVGDDQGARARIVDLDLNRRRSDLGILRD